MPPPNPRRVGILCGRKLAAGFTPKPDDAIHSASTQFIKQNNATFASIGNKLDAQRAFKAAAYQEYNRICKQSSGTFEERYGPWICMGCGKSHPYGDPCMEGAT